MRHLTHEGNLMLSELVQEVSCDLNATNRETLMAVIIGELLEKFDEDPPQMVRDLI